MQIARWIAKPTSWGIGAVAVVAIGATVVTAQPRETEKDAVEKARKSGYKSSKGRKLKKIVREVQRMDNVRLGESIKGLDKKMSGTSGRWSFEVDGVEMMVITDERADRMRIIAPIVSAEKLDRDALVMLLEANFDRALDPKYTIWQDVIWATYTHPLSPLTKAQFRSAAKQVAALKNTFGSTYSSMDIVFGGAGIGAGAGSGATDADAGKSEDEDPD